MKTFILRLTTLGSLCLLGCFLSPAGLAFGEDFGDLQDEMEQELNDFLSEIQEEKALFRDERDRDFAEFLQEQWKEFDELSGLIADRTPKPVKIPKISKAKDAVAPAGQIVPLPISPVTPPDRKPLLPSPKPETVPGAVNNPDPGAAEEGAPPAVPQKVAPSQLPLPLPTPIKVVEKEDPPPGPEVPVLGESAVELDFYGNHLQLPCDPALKLRLQGAPGNQSIAAYWRELSQVDFIPTVNRLLALRGELELNDWGFYQLTLQTAGAIHGKNSEATLLCWFLLCKSGYKAKVGYSEGDLYLLAPTEQTLYGIPYYTLDNSRYYNFTYIATGQKPGRLYTYQEDYPGAEQAVRMLLNKIPVIRPASATRQLTFSYAGTTYEIPVTSNPNTLRFLASYPQTDLPVFFTAGIEPSAEQSLIASLAPILAGKSESEAVNILLRFVQTAFAYKTDAEQFGREKYLFAEETLFFPYSDCEDRSILFSYLVRRLTGLDVVGLHYPGHIATAVHFSIKLAGDQVVVGDKIYVVCDPTYTNANIGMAMPQYQAVNPEVIRIGN